MNMISKIKYVALSALMVVSLNINADYTAKFFIEGIAVQGFTPPTPPPTPGIDGDTTEQNGGESGQLTYTVSRTSGYNHSQFNVAITSNIYNCFSITPPPAIGNSVEYCDVPYPQDNSLYLQYTPPGIYTFEVKALNEYGGSALKSYSFNIEILPIANDKTSDGDLSFGFYKKIINQDDEFSVAINSSTFDCFEINIITNGAGNVESECNVPYPYSASIYLTDFGFSDAGQVQLEISGYNFGDELNAKKYPFYVTINAPEEIPVIDNFVLEFGGPTQYSTFSSPLYGDSSSISNSFVFFAGKAKEFKLDVTNGFSTGWINIPYYSTDVSEYAVGSPLPSQSGGFHELLLSVRNESNVVTMSKNIELGSTAIDEINFNLCNASDPSNCYGSGMAIWSGGTGDNASITFHSNNTDCMSIQSDDDVNFNIAQGKCYYNEGTDKIAVFYTNYPNHDPSGQTPKIYRYNYTAINETTGEEVNGVFPVTIYYD